MPFDQQFDIASLHNAYAGGLDPVAVVEESYRRTKKVADPGIFLHLVDPEVARAEAEALGPFDPVGKPLWGIPFAIKDNIDAKGTPTTAGCPDFAYTAKADAFAVSVLRKAGAILIGKTNLDQFATGLVGVRTPYPIPRNAIDPAIVPGGSSSGSAIAVAHGIVGFALGTDTAGSGRVPAALNNVVGLKPSLGAISISGVVPACRTIDTVSVYALTVDDAYCVFRTAAIRDPSDEFGKDIPAPPLSAPPPSFRVGAPGAATRKFFGDADQADSFASSLDRISEMGGEIVEIDFAPFYQVAEMLYDGIWVAERYTVVEKFLKERPEALHPVTKRVIEVAERFSAADAFRSFYRLAELKHQLGDFFATVDIFCVPSIPTFFSLDDLVADPIGPNSRLGTYTNFVNLLDMCGIAVPTERRADGRPGGVTLLGPSGRDSLIAAVGGTLQRICEAPLGATGWPLPASAPAESALDRDELALAVVGAHMSGLPLNHELTRLGGRFLRAAKTSSEYRLFNLADGPPMRPGLLRDESGTAIALEVWALPASHFGDFIQGIPSPLGIGTISLDDGTEVKGFLCESHAIANVQDITHYGGWRAFLASHRQAPSRASGGAP